MTKRPRPWERQPCDTHKSWAAFVAYRDMGEDRSLRGLSDVTNKPASKYRQYGEWSTKHNWVERAAAFDAHMDSIRVMEDEREQRRWARAQLRAARKMMEKGEASMDASDVPLDPKEARMYVETGAKLQRLITGEATERTETRDVMDIAEFRRLRKEAQEGGDE